MNCTGASFSSAVRLARQLVALRLFLADRQQPDARLLRCRAPAARRPLPSPRTAAGAPAGTRRSRRRRAAPRAPSWSGSPSPAPADRRRAAARAPRAPPSRSRRCSRAETRPPPGHRPRLPTAMPDRRARLAPERRRRRLVHADDVRRVDDLESAATPHRRCRASSASMRSFGPTRMTPEARWRAAATAPSTIGAGAWSPPMASTATAGERRSLEVDTRERRTRRPPTGGYASSTGRTCRPR